jgi:outer membrane assembly lipoprotein YfiO
VAAGCLSAAGGCVTADFGRSLSRGGDFSEEGVDYDTPPWWSTEAYSNKHIKRRWFKMIGQGPDESIARAAFDEGEGLFRAKRYHEAEKKYKYAARRAPDSAIEEDSLFKLAECQFFTDRYSKAIDTYGELLKTYDNSRHLDTISRRRFAVGDYWERLYVTKKLWPLAPNLVDKHRPMFDTGGHAIKAFQSIMESDSTGPLADDAVMQMANAYFKRGHYNDAADYYKMLRENYPKSEHQFTAHLLGLQSELRRYQGPHYDDKPLDNADKLVEQLLTQFPGEADKDRPRLLETRQMLRGQRALREVELARYYDRLKYYGAAKRHYTEVVKQWPQTPLADEATERLAQISSEPDNPPSMLARAQTALAAIMPGGESTDPAQQTPAGPIPAEPDQPPYNVAGQPVAGPR